MTGDTYTDGKQGSMTSDDAARADAGAAFADLASPEGRQDPYTRYARIRAVAPAYLIPQSSAFVLTGYDGCERVLRDTAGFLVTDPAWSDRIASGWREHPSMVSIGQSLLNQNPPEHTRLRRLVSSAFTARRVGALAERVSGLIDARLDEMAEAGADGSSVDFHRALALPLPIAVIGTLLGIPEKDWPWLRDRSADLAEILDIFGTEESIAIADRAQLAVDPYLRDLAEYRRREPGDDLLSALVALRDEPDDGAGGGSTGGAGLDDDEIVRMVSLLFLAGYETTVNLLTNGVVALLRRPEQARRLRDDLALADSCVEEALRYDAPVQATSRIVAADTEISGVSVPAGSEVLIMIGAANRDPARFEAPDRFEIDRFEAERGTPKVLSFGGGVHFCLGAPLARLEARLVLPGLVRRFPGLALGGEPGRRDSFNLRGYASVPVTLR